MSLSRIKPSDPLQLRAEAMLKAASDLSALSIPLNVPAAIREPLIEEAGLATALDRLMMAAMETRARPMHAIALVALNRGREHGMSFGEIWDSVADAFRQAAEARAEQEAVAQESAKPPAQA